MKSISNKYKNKPRNKSLKNIHQLPFVPMNYYSKNYKNKEVIPKTQIINYIFSGYDDFLLKMRLSDSLGVYSLSLEQCFIIKPDDFPIGLRNDTINLTLKMNPQTPLDQLIAYSFYLKQPDIFITDNGLSLDKRLSIIKNQIGKDISRTSRKINGKVFSSEYYNKFENNYKSADMFYQNIIDELYKIDYKYVNLNIANKFSLLSCQNILNLITDLITFKLEKILANAENTAFKANIYNNIIINQDEISMEINYKSDLIISRDGEPMDPEYPCGKLEFSLFIDILHSKYEMRNFIISYDIDKCGPEKLDEPIVNKEPVIKTNLRAEYVVPASLITAGIIATPILLATLGGKKRKYIKKTKKRRNHK